MVRGIQRIAKQAPSSFKLQKTPCTLKTGRQEVSLFADALRSTEQAKIDCGREHFKALGDEVGFTVANNFDTFIDQIV